ncbi:PAS domain S-box protein [Haloarcula litorea]|uniref:PAS domain S-box protein n=1 Tax=Haloarcula litorea TaxID=3032579 RepID=UPI0023E898B2|nr:PAS domain S-box protein [Halomicroarcula sp. GDY20]
MPGDELTPTQRETLGVFGADREPLTTSEVATRLDLGRRSAYDRLRHLVDCGRLATKKVGASGRVWWRPVEAATRGAGQQATAGAGEGPSQAGELESVLERIDDAFFALDDDWRFTYVNDRAETLLEQSADALLGQRVWDAFPGTVDSAFEAEYRRAMRTGESRSFQARYPPLDRLFDVTAYPSESGLSVYFRDITQRRARERELERYEAIIETMDDGVYVVGEDGTLTFVNDAYADLLGEEPADLLGRHASAIVDEETAERAHTLQSELRDGSRETARMETTLTTADGDEIVAEATFSLLDGPEPGTTERIGVVRDVTERHERERRLEQYETVVETVDDGVYVVDDRNRFVMVNEAHTRLTGYDREELLGAEATLVTSETDLARADRRNDALVDSDEDATTIETELLTADGDTVPVETRFTPFPMDGDEQRYGRAGVVREVTDRKRRERLLRTRARQQSVIAALGRQSLDDGDLDGLMDEATRRVAETLAVDYVKVLDLDDDGDELLLRAGTGWDEGIVGSATVSAVENGSQAAYTLDASDPVVVEDLADEERFDGPDLLTNHDVRSGISVLIGPDDDPWGILGVHDTEPRSVSPLDVNFVQSVANTLAAAIEAHARKQELIRQREQLSALDELNRVVRETTDAVIEQSTREEIEETVCERLAATESYLFAWLGGVETGSSELVTRAQAGAADYLDEIETSIDPDDDLGQGPTGRAFRTRETQTVDDVETDADYAPWSVDAVAHGIRSSAAVPIVHDKVLYGVLSIYAGRTGAFEGRERAVVDQLGEFVGHAIAATERKQALMSDEVVELEFEIADVFEDFGVESGEAGRITIENTVPISDDEFRIYGAVTPEGRATLRTAVEEHPHWHSLTVRGDQDRRFEFCATEPPILSTLAAVGGRIERGVVRDGDYYLTVHVPPSADVRRIIDAVDEHYPSSQLLKRRQTTREDPRARVQQALTDDLTDRQRTTLEIAHGIGFFEWPREATAEEAADSLGVAAPTFHQHLRKAQRKVFDSLLAARTAARPTE